MNMELSKQAVEFVELADATVKAAVKEAEDARAQKRAWDEALAAGLPAAVDALIKFNRLAPDRRKEAMDRLRAEPATLLSVLTLAANPDNTLAPRSMGTPVKAAAEQAPSPAGFTYSGMRTNRRGPADEAYEQELNIRR